MKRTTCLLLLSLSIVAAAWSENQASDKPGFVIVEETVYHDVVKCVCKLVPDIHKKKTWVYTVKDEPFCIKRTLCGKACTDDCAECAQCRGPFHRKLLIKREVIEECPTMKCVVEHIVEKVPCKVYRRVPVSQTESCAPLSTPPQLSEASPKKE